MTRRVLVVATGLFLAVGCETTSESRGGQKTDTGESGSAEVTLPDGVACTSQCTDASQTQCDGAGLRKCVDANGDGCFEWGPATPCSDGLPCSAGACSATCTSECTVANARSCDPAGGVVVCDDPDGDGCLKWVAGTACVPPQVCSGGDCALFCKDECPAKDMKECVTGSTTLFKTCGHFDSDTCLEWGETSACGGVLVCSGGECAATCSDTCPAAGTIACDGNGIHTCGDTNADGCLEWGDTTACPGTKLCVDGACTGGCINGCTSDGAVKCDGNSVLTCTKAANGCLGWQAPTACDPLVCANGVCKAQCENACSTVGALKCDAGGVTSCGDPNGDGCLEWSTPTDCPLGETCSSGACKSQCTNECTSVGALKCEQNGVVSCGDYNNDACLEWSTAVACGEGLSCNSGKCELQCTSDCTIAGAVKCDEGGNRVTCTDLEGLNGTGCLKWGSPVACPAPQVCSQGACALGCSNDCEAKGTQQCVAGTLDQLQTCDDWDADGCLEWGTATACGGGLVCSGDTCVASCTDACSVDGGTTCEGKAVKTCGDWNGDSCLEWGTPLFCKVSELCLGGICKPLPKLLISEVVVDTAGSPDTDSFVEVFGPAGTDLTGFTLVGVNGADAKDYATINLDGKTIPADGLFVVAYSNDPVKSPTTAAVGDMFSTKVDLQNGPDSIQLRQGTAVVDALAYGAFGPTDTKAGEGAPALKVAAAHSLGRDGQETDTHDNLTDFKDYAAPTPGAPNGAQPPVNKAPVAELKCPVSAKVGEAVLLDGSGSTDADGLIASYSFDFGAGVVAGNQPTATQVFDAAADVVVELTVTDDKGATANASCSIAIAPAGAPDKVISTAVELCGTQTFGKLTLQGGAKVTCASGSLDIAATEVFIDPASSIDVSATSNEVSGYAMNICGRSCAGDVAFTGAGGGGNGTVGGSSATNSGCAKSPEQGGCLGSCVQYSCTGASGGFARSSATDLRAVMGGAGGSGCKLHLYGSDSSCWGTNNVTKGGRGGGAVRIIASKSITVQGAILADGEKGVDYEAGSGGGAGGSVVLAAPSIAFTGTISAAGGLGGTGNKPSSYYGVKADGGAGGKGMVKLVHGDTLANTGTINGAITVMTAQPPLAVTSSTHPNPSLAYNDTFSDFQAAWVPPFTGLTGYWYAVNQSANFALTPQNGTYTEGTVVTIPAATFKSPGRWYLWLVSVDAAAKAGTVASRFDINVNGLPLLVSSTSHADPNSWYTGTTIALSWAPPADVPAASFKGYWYRLDRVSNTGPANAKTEWTYTTNPQANLTKDAAGQAITSFAYHFHIVGEDTRGFLTSKASSFLVQVGTAPEKINAFGYVRDSAGVGLKDAVVRFEPYGTQTVTDQNGYFILNNVISGNYTILTTLPGYKPSSTPVAVAAGAMPLNVVLAP